MYIASTHFLLDVVSNGIYHSTNFGTIFQGDSSPLVTVKHHCGASLFPDSIILTSIDIDISRLACDNLPEESVGRSGKVLTGGGDSVESLNLRQC